MLLFLVSAAFARGPTGMAVPVMAGPMSSPVEVGAAGLAYTPTAAWVDRTELMVDIGETWSSVETTLDGQATESGAGWDLVPTLAVAWPAGPVSMGLMLFAPHGRGSEGAEDGPGRFHGISGTMRVLEADLDMAFSPTPGLVLGVGLRAGSVTLETTKATDTGALIAGLTEADDDELIGAAFLEGRQALSNSKGAVAGFTVGAMVEPSESVRLVAWYRSNLWGQTTADLSYRPSNDLTVVLESTVTTPLRLPMEAGAAMRIRRGALTLSPEFGWTEWSSWAVLVSETSGLAVRSDDETLDALLEAGDLDFEDLIGGVGDSVSVNGNRDVFHGGLGASYDVGQRYQVRGGLWFSPASVPDEYVHPSNLDFASLDLRAGGVVALGRGTRLALTGDWFFIPERTVTTSKFEVTADGESGLALPSGAGVYDLNLGRIGLTWIQTFQRRSDDREFAER